MIEIADDRIDNAQWDEYAQGHPDATVYHLSAWKHIAREAYGIADRSLAALEQGRIVGLLPLHEARDLRGGRYLTSGIFGAYNGILADREEARSRLLERAISLCADNRYDRLVIKDTRQQGDPRFAVSLEYVTHELPLSPDPERIWTAFRDKTRNQVRKAEKSGLSVECNNAGLPEFSRVYARNMRDMGTPFLGSVFLEKVLQHFAGRAELFLVRLKARAIAGGILLRFRDRAYLPFASSLKRFNSHCPNNLLYWEAIRRACLHGAQRFDFGRSTVDSGPYHFKKQWGAGPVQLYYCYYPGDRGTETFNPHDRKYRLCVRLWRLMPVRAANAIGPRIIGHFV